MIKLEKTKNRKIVVILFTVVFVLVSFVVLRNEYVQYKNLGKNYEDVFFTNLKYRGEIFVVNFILLYLMLYFTNKSIIKGLKEFFDKENKEMHKMPNKSISYIISVLVSSVMSYVLLKKSILVFSNSSFAESDPIFNLDISFFIFTKPLLNQILVYLITILISLSVYMVFYYIIVFNRYFDGIDGEMVKNSLLIKQLLKNVMRIIVLVAIITVINTTNIDLSRLLTVKDNNDTVKEIEIIGASYTDNVLQRWGKLIFAAIIIIEAYLAIRAFKKDQTTNVIKHLAFIPGYLVAMFAVIMVYDAIFVNSNKLEKERYYLESNIKYTQNAYNIDVEEQSLDDVKTISSAESDIKVNLPSGVEETSTTKVPENTDIINKAKVAMPYLIYDEDPYSIETESGRKIWVLDAYTISNQYPYSQYSTIKHDNIKEKVNYIRNSIKVLMDDETKEIKFYLIDRTDPIAMAYYNIYPTLFETTEISSEISSKFVYPEYLYDVQSEVLKTYHNIKYDELYRANNIWNFAKYNSTITSNSTGTILEPYYQTIEEDGKEKTGLIQIYTPENKQNIISYLIGTTEGGNNKLKLYRFSQDSSILGPMQLDNQIEQDETMSATIEALNTPGARVTKRMIILPVQDTLLYVEPIYQTTLNEKPRTPVIKKIVVSAGNKVAIGDNLSLALNNLRSQDASNINVENTDNMDDLIDSIIKANKNLTDSTKNNNWELMGSDMEKLQSLIDSLEKLKEEQDKEKEENEKFELKNANNSVNDDVNSVDNGINSIGNNLIK